MQSDYEILDRFVSCFQDPDDPFDPLLVKKQETSSEQLETIYSELPIRLPRIFETLLLRFRWKDAFIGDSVVIELMDNPPGVNLSPWLNNVKKDPNIFETTTANKFVQFGKFNTHYDPVCFSETAEIIVLDHEEILCNSRIRVLFKLASSFEELMEKTLSRTPFWKFPFRLY